LEGYIQKTKKDAGQSIKLQRIHVKKIRTKESTDVCARGAGFVIVRSHIRKAGISLNGQTKTRIKKAEGEESRFEIKRLTTK